MRSGHLAISISEGRRVRFYGIRAKLRSWLTWRLLHCQIMVQLRRRL
jgi:hypothetical protein